MKSSNSKSLCALNFDSKNDSFTPWWKNQTSKVTPRDSFTRPKHRVDQVIKFLCIRKQRDVSAVSFYCFHILSDIHSLCLWTGGKEGRMGRAEITFDFGGRQTGSRGNRSRTKSVKRRNGMERENRATIAQFNTVGREKSYGDLSYVPFVQCATLSSFFKRKTCSIEMKNFNYLAFFMFQVSNFNFGWLNMKG